MIYLLIAILSISSLVLAVAFQGMLVYLWLILASFYILFPGVSLIEGMNQTLYGIASLACLPSMFLAFLVKFTYLRKHLVLFSPVALVIIALFASGLIHKIPLIEILRELGGMLVFTLMCLFSCTFLSNNKSIKVLLCLLVFISVAVCMSALIDYFYLQNLTRSFGSTVRAGSVFVQNPNVFSHYCLFFFSVSLSMFFESKKPLIVPLVLFYLLCIIITFSNSGLAGLIVSCGVLFLLYRLYKKPLYVLFSFSCFFLAVIILFQMQYFNSPALHHVATGGTFTHRINHIWPEALALIEKSILFGYTPDLAAKLLGISTHNEILSIVLNYGLLGALSILLFLSIIFIKLNKVRNHSESIIFKGVSAGCMAYMCGALIYGVAHSIGFSSTVIFSFWFVAMASIGTLKKL